MIFKVGQPVVCIDDTWAAPFRHLITGELPKAGSIYHVREYDSHMEGDRMYLWLREFKLPCLFGAEPSFAADCFRPLKEAPNNGEAFVEKLKKISVPQTAPRSKELCGND